MRRRVWMLTALAATVTAACGRLTAVPSPQQLPAQIAARSPVAKAVTRVRLGVAAGGQAPVTAVQRFTEWSKAYAAYYTDHHQLAWSDFVSPLSTLQLAIDGQAVGFLVTRAGGFHDTDGAPPRGSFFLTGAYDTAGEKIGDGLAGFSQDLFGRRLSPKALAAGRQSQRSGLRIATREKRSETLAVALTALHVRQTPELNARLASWSPSELTDLPDVNAISWQGDVVGYIDFQVATYLNAATKDARSVAVVNVVDPAGQLLHGEARVLDPKNPHGFVTLPLGQRR